MGSQSMRQRPVPRLEPSYRRNPTKKSTLPVRSRQSTLSQRYPRLQQLKASQKGEETPSGLGGQARGSTVSLDRKLIVKQSKSLCISVLRLGCRAERPFCATRCSLTMPIQRTRSKAAQEQCYWEKLVFGYSYVTGRNAVPESLREREEIDFPDVFYISGVNKPTRV